MKTIKAFFKQVYASPRVRTDVLDIVKVVVGVVLAKYGLKYK